MASRIPDTPVVDADNHRCETREALTKLLPDRYAGAIDDVGVRGRTEIMIRGQVSEYIPNPTFARFMGGNPAGLVGVSPAP